MSVFKKYISNNDEDSSSTQPSSASQIQAQTQNSGSSNSESKSASKTSSSAPQKQAAAAAPTSTVAATNGRNVLSSDVEIKGKVKFTNDLVVDGLIEGEVHSDGSLTVGENARIKAEIHTRSVVVYGKVHGNITVTDRVELKANAELIGDIKAATISIEAGAIFVGKSTVGAPSTQVATSTKKAKEVNSKGKLATAS